jgi:hypothetical protein
MSAGLLFASLLSIAVALGASATYPAAKSTSNQAKPFSVTVKDAKGDSKPSVLLATPPDLVGATFEVKDGNLMITVAFAPGTATDRTGVTIHLDTDEDVKTGAPPWKDDSKPIGADYVIRGVQPHLATRAALTHERGPGDSLFSGPLDVTLPTTDQRQIVVPLARLGNDDGRMKFRIECYQVIDAAQSGGASTQTILPALDVLPDLGKSAGAVR